MPGSHIDDKIDPADRTDGQMRADDGFGVRFARSGRGFVGGIGAAPVFPTTFIFGAGTALRTRRG
jgi:hypothetical protein